MPAVQHLAGHEKDLGGGFKVRRLLPAAVRRSVGPFVFFDHFGPVTEQPQDNHDVRPHPHIGLATVSYLFEGAMMHRDSVGSVQRIEPGAINWMSSGGGIVHSERKPDDLRQQAHVNHGLQLWVALPESAEESAPTFVHTPAGAIPQLQADAAQVRVLVGDAFGARSPVAPASPTLYLDVELPRGGVFDLPSLAAELAVYPVQGELTLDGEPAQRRMLVLQPGVTARIQADGPARFVVVGGEPLGPRYMYWNFVSSRKDRILQASADWEAGRFPVVPGDDRESIPLPPTRFTPPEPMS
ncbi:MAG: pirin family protein [Comamonadaceae bacterium]|nr:MAG: pirin family protein [Comamonadaceae bacterium]